MWLGLGLGLGFGLGFGLALAKLDLFASHSITFNTNQ